VCKPKQFPPAPPPKDGGAGEQGHITEDVQMLAYGGLDECEYIIEGLKMFAYGGAGNKWIGMWNVFVDQLLYAFFQISKGIVA